MIEIHDLEASLLPETKWYPRYERIIYTSGTLKFGNNKKYLPQRLGLTEVTFKTLPTPYNYAENARVYVPEEAVAIQNASSYEMGQYISDTIEKLMAQEERSMLVLLLRMNYCPPCIIKSSQDYWKKDKRSSPKGLAAVVS